MTPEATRKIGAVPRCVKLKIGAFAAPSRTMNQEPLAPNAAPDRQLEKRQTLWLLLALFFVAGWFSAIIGEKSSYYPLYQLFFGLGSTLFIVRWVALDAIERRFPLTPAWIFFFVLISLLALPFYLIKTRGVGSWRPILFSLGLLFAYSIAAGIGESIATAVGL